MMFFGSQWQKLSDHEVMNLWMIHTWDYHYHRVDGTNPAPVDMVNTPFFFRVSYMSGGAGFLPSTVGLL